jgi:hypothetical protein
VDIDRSIVREKIVIVVDNKIDSGDEPCRQAVLVLVEGYVDLQDTCSNGVLMLARTDNELSASLKLEQMITRRAVDRSGNELPRNRSPAGLPTNLRIID